MKGYDHRLVVSRELYDQGVGVTTSPSLDGLARGTRVHLAAKDHEKLGAPSRIRVVGAKGSLEADAVCDPGLPAGSVWIPFNQPGADVASLLDSSQPVIDVQIETVA